MNAALLLEHYAEIADAPDAIARLRRFVLDLAVRGKLVDQDESDEPATDLLERIKANAAEGHKRRGRGRDTSAGNALEDIPFEAPKGWTFARLGELVRVLNGRAYKQQELLDKGIPVLRVGNLFTSNHWYYSDLALDDDKHCDAGDLLYAWSASFGPFIWNGPRVIYHYHIWKLPLVSEADLDKHYLYNFLLQKTREIKDAGHGISMVHMTKEKMEKLIVPLPPLAEQHRIVAKVNELTALCDQLEAARAEREATRDTLTLSTLAKLNTPDPATFGQDARFALANLAPLTTRPDQIKQLRQTILNLAVRGDLSADAAWSQASRPLGSVANLQNGYAFKSQWFAKSGVRLLRNANVAHGELSWADEVRLPSDMASEFERFALNRGDIVVSLDRPFIVSGTKVARVKDVDLPALLLQRVGRFVLTREITEDYLFLWVNSPHFSSQIDPGRSNGVPHISSRQVESAEIFLPPLAEQQRIVAKVDELMVLCDGLETSITKGEQARSRLLESVLHHALEPA